MRTLILTTKGIFKGGWWRHYTTTKYAALREDLFQQAGNLTIIFYSKGGTP